MKLTDNIYMINLIKDLADFGVINKEDSVYYHKLRISKITKEEILQKLIKRSKITYDKLPYKYRKDIDFLSLLIKINKLYIIQIWETNKTLAYDVLDRLTNEELNEYIYSVRPTMIMVMHDYLKVRRNAHLYKNAIAMENVNLAKDEKENKK